MDKETFIIIFCIGCTIVCLMAMTIVVIFYRLFHKDIGKAIELTQKQETRETRNGKEIWDDKHPTDTIQEHHEQN